MTGIMKRRPENNCCKRGWVNPSWSLVVINNFLFFFPRTSILQVRHTQRRRRRSKQPLFSLAFVFFFALTTLSLFFEGLDDSTRVAVPCCCLFVVRRGQITKLNLSKPYILSVVSHARPPAYLFIFCSWMAPTDLSSSFWCLLIATRMKPLFVAILLHLLPNDAALK